MRISVKVNHTVMQLLAVSWAVERQLGDSELKIDPGMRKCKLRAMRLEHSYQMKDKVFDHFPKV